MKESKTSLPLNTSEPGDAFAAKQLARGLTLVPYRGYSPNSGPLAGIVEGCGGSIGPHGHGEPRPGDGRRIACCAWIKLKPGESIAAAAGRLSALAARW